MSEAKLTKPRQRLSRSKAPSQSAHVQPVKGAAATSSDSLQSSRWCGRLLWLAAIAVAMLAAVYYGKTRFKMQPSELGSTVTSQYCHLLCRAAVSDLFSTQMYGCSTDENTTTDQSDVDSINNIEGIFPKGCQWRDLQHDGQKKKFWSEEEYEYWHGDVKQWTPDTPSGCSVRGKPATR